MCGRGLGSVRGRRRDELQTLSENDKTAHGKQFFFFTASGGSIVTCELTQSRRLDAKRFCEHLAATATTQKTEI